MPPPQLSVVIAISDDTAALGRCLESLLHQTQPPETFEVIVADGGSTAGTLEALTDFPTPFALRAIRAPGSGGSALINAAVETASGSVCVFLGTTLRASRTFLAAHAIAHDLEPQILAIGRVALEPPAKADWFGRAAARSRDRHYDRLAQTGASWSDCWIGNMSVRREVLLEVGGFSADPNTDAGVELGFRLSQRGYRVRYARDAIGTYTDHLAQERLLARQEERAAVYLRMAERQPAMLPELLGSFGATVIREILLRKLLLAARASPQSLVRLGSLIVGGGRQDRWFEFVSRLTFWRAVSRSVDRRRWCQLTRGVPVLLYHGFDERGAGRFVISRKRFRRQMLLLNLLRYRVIALEDLVATLSRRELPPPRAVTITIDDGYRDVLTFAAPTLARRNFPATLFLIAHRLGGMNDWDASGELVGRRLLSKDEALRVSAGGIRIGSHTQTHPWLAQLQDGLISEEILDARNDLERELGTCVNVFSYPHGAYDDRSLAAVRRAYDGACTTEPRLVRLNDDPFLIPRVEIYGTDSLLRFLIKLWLGWPGRATRPRLDS
jgi:peptidoglycan/xylan/chitin deacetylase (PgdA/CDA1 family)/GT2 family glycosyltransferase